MKTMGMILNRPEIKIFYGVQLMIIFQPKLRQINAKIFKI